MFVASHINRHIVQNKAFRVMIQIMKTLEQLGLGIEACFCTFSMVWTTANYYTATLAWQVLSEISAGYLWRNSFAHCR